MALGNSTSQIYLRIADGKVVRAFQSPTDKSVSRITKTGKTVHEESYDYVEGYIRSITTKTNEYGKFWVITLEDDETYTIELNYSSGAAQSFLKTLPNVNLAEPVTLKPKQTIENDKKRTSILVIQNGHALKWHWTKENPGDMPQLKKIKVKGVESWDDSDIMEFLENYVTTTINPKIQSTVTVDAEDDF